MNKENQKPMIKGIVICVLSLVLLICIPFINSLISERQSFQAEVTNEVTSKWGQHQTIYGPFIYVEYQKEYVLKDNNVVKKTNTNLIMPINQSITGDLKTQIKKRSLYEVTLYNADLMLNAQFQNLETIAKKLKLESPAEFTKVKLIFAISDSRGFMQQITVNNTPSLVFEQDPNLENNSSLNLLSCDLTSLETPMTEVSFPLQLKGSTQLNFLATAKQNKVNLKTDYSDIKYIGNYLPDTENQEISQTDPSWTIFQSFPVNTNLKDTYSLEQFSYG